MQQKPNPTTTSPERSGSAAQYERLLRGEIGSKQFVESLRDDARAHRRGLRSRKREAAA